MKKLLSILLIFCLTLTLAACGDKEESSTPSGGTAIPPANDTAEILPEGEKLTSLPDFFPQKFVLGVNPAVWCTELTLKSDGNFSGKYLEHFDEADADSGYPNGTVYICEFTGCFDSFMKVDEYTYAMKLKELKPAYGPEEFWIEEGVLYSTAHPVGIADGEWFYIYLPGKPTANLDEAFKLWRNDLPEVLDVYGLYNPKARYAFFGS